MIPGMPREQASDVLTEGCAGYGLGTTQHNGGRLNLDGRLQPGGAVWGAGPQQQASARMATASSVLGTQQTVSSQRQSWSQTAPSRGFAVSAAAA